MIGLRLTEFITRLRTCTFLSEYDLLFLKRISEQFGSLDPTVTLSSIQLELMLKFFSDRWTAIADDPEYDYTFSLTDSNECWIKLARLLADATGKSYLQILMPTITNATDPNNGEKHADSDDLRVFYIGEDGKSLYSLSGLLKLSLLKKMLISYKADSDVKKNTSFPLSLRELFRLRSKQGAPIFEVFGLAYDNFGDYLTNKIAPEWHDSGEVPRHLLPSLLELVELYFTEKSDRKVESKFLHDLILWSQYLYESRIDDVNCLYGQTILVDNKKTYLIDVLLDCMQGEHSTLQNKIEGLARWLCEYDASLIAGCKELTGLYSELNVGIAFQLSNLKTNLIALQASSTASIRRLIISLNVRIAEKVSAGNTDIDPEIVGLLSALYKQRWDLVQGKDDDYTRSQSGANKKWIHLAELLCGAGHIKKNYYGFLMPTLVGDIDPVGQGCLTDNPLSHCVFSTKKYDELICLDDAEREFEAFGTFNNCNRKPSLPLTDIALERMQYAHIRFRQYIKIAGGGEDSPPIAKATIMAVYDLVNDSVNPVGWRKKLLSPQQQSKAEAAYARFFLFLGNLPQEELDRLYLQRIVLQGKNRSFKTILDEVKAGGCAAACGKYFAKLVRDYFPYMQFIPELEGTELIHEMVKDTRKRVPSNYNSIDENEAKRRLRILAVSIMSHDFQCPRLGDSLSIWDCSNTVPSVIKDVYQLLEPMILSGDFTHARFVYAKIMETVVNPALVANNSWLSLSYWMRSNDTQQWLESVANNILFSQKGVWFKPEVLMASLQPLPRVDPVTSHLLDTFLEELVHTYAQSETTLLKELRVNIKFTQLLNSLEPTIRCKLLLFVDSSSRHADERICANFLVQRVAAIGVVAGQQQVGFFNKGPNLDQATLRRIEFIKKTLNEVVNSTDFSMPLLCVKLGSKIDEMTKQTCDDQAKIRIKHYLNKIRLPIISLSSTAHLSVVNTSKQIAM